MADHLFGITDTGRVRENNEDVFIAKEIMDGQFMVAGVIDGVGGYAGGEIAAAITKDIILNRLEIIGKDVIAQLIIAFDLANEEIFAKKLTDEELTNMACVATLAVIDKQNNLLHYIHVGDTRLYLFRDNSLVKISHDQSFVGFLEDSGRITEEAAMQHPKRNQINQALGLGSRAGMTDTYFETGSSPFLPGDLILVCSDGLTDLIDKAAIETILGSPAALEQQAENLVKEANNAGGRDNVTVVLAKNNNTPVLHDIARPVQDPGVPAAALRPVSLPVRTAITEEQSIIKIKKRNSLIAFLSVLCMLFLGTAVWLFLRPQTEIRKPVKEITVHKLSLNTQEKLIRDTLSKLKGDTLLLSADAFKGVVRLSQPLNINRDTLILKTTGNLVFQSDAAYKGPALVFSPACKYIVIDKLVLENFETGIVSYNNTLSLKNVRFNNCRQPLQVLFVFPDHLFMNGRISRYTYQADSLAKK